jgi:tryptophan synthase alpha chain
MKLIHTLIKHGADVLEFGIPFSDPTADGPTFQMACERALRKSMTPVTCIQGIKKLRRSGLETPIVVTSYFNIIYTFGLEAFLSEIKKAGAQGILVPDIPVEEAWYLLSEGKRTGIHVILQVAPTTTNERLKNIADVATGFLYVINVEGVTGARTRLTNSSLKLVNRVKRHTDLPLLVGFGISEGKHAAAIVSAGADGVIVGSAYTRIYEKSIEQPEKRLPEIARLASQIKLGCIEGYDQRSKRGTDRNDF